MAGCMYLSACICTNQMLDGRKTDFSHGVHINQAVLLLSNRICAFDTYMHRRSIEDMVMRVRSAE